MTQIIFRVISCTSWISWIAFYTLLSPVDQTLTMTTSDHSRILAIGFAAFAVIYLFTFLLLLVVTGGVFVALGITMANDTGDPNQAGIGILGAVFTVIFYGVLGLICVLPPAMASWKLFKRKPKVRFWGIIASIVVLPILPLGTALGGYGLWFMFSGPGKKPSPDSSFK